MEELSLLDIIAIANRRKNYFFVTAFVIAVAAILFALSWSNYRSIATVEIDQSYIPANVTTPIGMSPDDTMMAVADQRISLIEQKVTSSASLAEIIAKFNLYPGARGGTPIAQLTTTMFKKIKLALVSSTTSNPAAAQKETAEQLSAIAFTLSFDYGDPLVAQQVTDELVTRFLDEDLKERRTQAQEVSAFLASQISEIETSMAEQEKKIADFRAKFGESGPAALMFNEQAASSAAFAIQNLDGQLTTNEGTQGALKAQLAVVEPYSRVIAEGQVLTTPAIQLKALEAQYATLSGQYGPDHPDVVKVRNEIKTLRPLVKQSGNSAQLKAQIADVRTNLEAAKSTEGPDNPDIITLQHQLDALEQRLAASPKGTTQDDGIKADADNPAYLELVAQLRSSEAQHKSLSIQKETLASQLTRYQKILADNPGVERQMAALSRDYDNAQLRYRELKEKKQAADMSVQVEKDRKGQRLVVINPPSLPEDTHPSRLLLILGGLIFAILGGLGSIAVVEATSQSVHGPTHLASLVGVAPLVTIPHMITEEEKIRHLRLKRYGFGGTALLILLLAAASFFR
jgi:uncharacterized protein involved in exopolysaccharide biosynthesis